MTELPAFCKECGAVFGSGFTVKGNFNKAVFYGNEVGPCPACGGMGRIPDGVYNITDKAIKLLSGPKVSKVQLGKLAHILSEAREEASDPSEVEARIHEETPAFSDIADLLPSVKEDFLGYLGILLAIIGLVSTSPAQEVNVNVVIEETKSSTKEEIQKSVSKVQEEATPADFNNAESPDTTQGQRKQSE